MKREALDKLTGIIISVHQSDIKWFKDNKYCIPNNVHNNLSDNLYSLYILHTLIFDFKLIYNLYEKINNIDVRLVINDIISITIPGLIYNCRVKLMTVSMAH